MGDEWHIYAGQIDLFNNVVRRRSRFIEDDQLSDAPLNT